MSARIVSPEGNVFGEVTLPWAWYGISGGSCPGRLNAFIYADPPPPVVGHSNVGTYLLVAIYAVDWPDGFAGTGPASFEMFYGSKSYYTTGEITISGANQDVPEMCDAEAPIASDARFDFALAVHGVYWEIEGMVSAAYCPTCNVFCPDP